MIAVDSSVAIAAFGEWHQLNHRLDDRFADVLEPPDAAAQRQLVRVLASHQRIGGSIYDAVIGLTAKLAGAELVTADTRAHSTYGVVGVTTRWLAP